jgi:hypothetical protein
VVIEPQEGGFLVWRLAQDPGPPRDLLGMDAPRPDQRFCAPRGCEGPSKRQESPRSSTSSGAAWPGEPEIYEALFKIQTWAGEIFLEDVIGLD